MRVVVVGNGIVALTAALRLSERGAEVCIVGDPARRGSATLAAAAMLSAFAELEGPAFADPRARTKLLLARDAVGAWDRLAADLGVSIGRGTYVIDDSAAFQAIVGELRAAGEPHAVVAAMDVPGYRGRERAVRIDREGWLDPRAVVDALERRLRVEWVAGIARRVLGAAGVELADGREVRGDRCLLAPGATLSALLAASDLPLHVPRVRYGVGATVELRAPGHTACLRAHGVYSVPRADRVVVGATNVVVDAPVDDPAAATRIIAAASAALDPQLAGAEIVRVNVGWRPTTDDGYPLIGATSVPGLAIASGTRRDGFHLAPVIADHLSAVVLGEPGDARFSVFSPER